jgi:hypothetical protein
MAASLTGMTGKSGGIFTGRTCSRGDAAAGTGAWPGGYPHTRGG